MHPVIMRQLAADHIGEIHAKAEDERRARQARWARRRAASTRPRPRPAGRWVTTTPAVTDPGGSVMTEQDITPPQPVMAASRPGNGDASAQREIADHSS